MTIAPLKITRKAVGGVLPGPVKRKLYFYMTRYSPKRYLEQRALLRSTDIFVLSFPKCGRTWLRLMIGKAIATRFDVQSKNILNLRQFHKINPNIPSIVVTHDEGLASDPWELSRSKSKYKHNKVIFLIRDPRDVIVSLFFHYTRRDKRFEGDISAFVHDTRNLATIISYYNLWANNRHRPKDFLLVRYEDLHHDPRQILSNVLEFCGIWPLDEEIIDNAIQWCSFDNMKKMEAEDYFQSPMLNVENVNDNEAYKTRKGVIGGYKEYLNDNDIRFVEGTIKRSLSDFYWYYK